MNWDKGIIRLLLILTPVLLVLEYFWSEVWDGPGMRSKHDYGTGPFFWSFILIWPTYLAGKWIVRGLKNQGGEDRPDE